TKVRPPVEAPEQPDNGNVRSVLDLRLDQLAAAASVALIARLPDLTVHSSWDPGVPWGRTVKQNIEELKGPYFTLQTKWRDHILIATYAGWFQEEAKRPPIEVVRRLRKSALEHDGFLPLADLIY